MSFLDDLKILVSSLLDKAYQQGLSDGVNKSTLPLKVVEKDLALQLAVIQDQLDALIGDNPPPKPQP